MVLYTKAQPWLLTLGYCACTARVTVVVLCVCVCVCNVLREMLDVNVKVEVPTQYKNEYQRRVFLKNASFPRNGNVSIYTATIERPFVAHAYKARWLIKRT